MKNSGVQWIGDIPSHWSVKRFRYLHDGANVGEAIGKEYWSNDDTDNVFYTAGEKFIHCTYRKFPEWKLVHGNDLLLSRNGTPYVYYPQIGALYTDHIIRVPIKVQICDKRFVRYNLQRSIEAEKVDVVMLATWSVSLWNEQRVCMPPLPEQKAIADFLDTKCAEIDALLQDLDAEVKTLAEYKKSIIAETVTKGLNHNVPMKSSGIPWADTIPEHWAIQKGKYTFKLLQRPVKEDDGVITCFRDGEVTLRSNRREDGFTMSAKEYGYQGIEPGDLVVHGMDGFAGSIGISDSRGKATPVLNVLDSEYNKRYLMYYLRNMAYGDVFLALSTGIRVRSCDLSWKKLGEIQIVLPPLDEQNEIANYIDRKLIEIQNATTKKLQQIETLKAYKSSLIYEYVTGKKQVPV